MKPIHYPAEEIDNAVRQMQAALAEAAKKPDAEGAHARGMIAVSRSFQEWFFGEINRGTKPEDSWDAAVNLFTCLICTAVSTYAADTKEAQTAATAHFMTDLVDGAMFRATAGFSSVPEGKQSIEIRATEGGNA